MSTHEQHNAVDPISNPVCANCGKPATCYGSYEGHEVRGYACDDCCGHGNEDGECHPVGSAKKLPFAPEPLDEQQAVLSILRQMDPWRRWTVSTVTTCAAGLDEHGPEQTSFFTVICRPGYESATRSDKFNDCQTLACDTLENCVSVARKAFESDLDAQIRVLTRNRMEAPEDVAVLRSVATCMDNVVNSQSKTDLYFRIHALADNIEASQMSDADRKAEHKGCRGRNQG
jgi:hypothetical protein